MYKYETEAENVLPGENGSDSSESCNPPLELSMKDCGASVKKLPSLNFMDPGPPNVGE